MSWRTFLIGLAGGVLLTSVLDYPLHQYLPGGWVEGWPATQALAAQIWAGFAVLLLAVYGALAARLSSAHNRLQAAGAGALTGLMAALIAEVLVGGGAAGVWGSRTILAHGLHATRDEAEFFGLLTDAITSTQWWTFASVWIAIAAGLGMGALGGIIAGRGGAFGRPEPVPWLPIILVGLLCSAVSTVVAIVVFPLLSAATQRGADQVSHTLIYSSATILAWPIATNFILLIAWQLLGRWILRRTPDETATDHALLNVMGWLYGLIPLGAGGLLLFIGGQYILNPVAFIGLVASVAIGVLTLRWSWSFQSRPQPAAIERPLNKRFFASIIVVGGGVWAIMSGLGTVAASVNIVSLIVSPMSVLALHDESAAADQAASLGQSITALVESGYQAHRIMVLVSSVSALVVTILIAALVWLVQWRVQRQLEREAAPSWKTVALETFVVITAIGFVIVGSIVLTPVMLSFLLR